MDNIKFRGFRTDGKGWVEGSLLKEAYNYYIIPEYDQTRTAMESYILHHDSLAMSTGLHDRNGKEIFGSVPVDGVMSMGGDAFQDGLRCVFADGIFGTTHDTNNQGVSRLSFDRCRKMTITGNQWEQNQEETI